MRSDLDLVFSHDERAIEQSEIADRALTVLSDRKRATGVTRNVIADDNRARLRAAKMPKNLRALAIKSVAKSYVWRDGMGPPIAFHMPISSDVVHNCGASFQLAFSLDRRLETRATIIL
jgi:hypothetical protein